MGEEEKHHSSGISSISLLIMWAENRGSLFAGGAELNQILQMQTLAMGPLCHAKGICLSQQPPAEELVIPYDISWQNDFVRHGVEVWKEEMSEMVLIPDNLFGV